MLAQLYNCLWVFRLWRILVPSYWGLIPMTQGKFGKTACKEPYIVLRYVIICYYLSLLVFILHLGWWAEIRSSFFKPEITFFEKMKREYCSKDTNSQLQKEWERRKKYRDTTNLYWIFLLRNLIWQRSFSSRFDYGRHVENNSQKRALED